jgi:hypothetical protein
MHVVCVFLVHPVTQSYMMIFPPLLNPMFWERPGNIPALTRLLVAYLSKAGQQIVAGGEYSGAHFSVGVVQQIVAGGACCTRVVTAQFWGSIILVYTAVASTVAAFLVLLLSRWPLLAHFCLLP